MTFAEILLLVAGGTGIYLLLRPLQRRLESWLRRRFLTRPSRVRPPLIDVNEFRSDETGGKRDRHP